MDAIPLKRVLRTLSYEYLTEPTLKGDGNWVYGYREGVEQALALAYETTQATIKMLLSELAIELAQARLYAKDHNSDQLSLDDKVHVYDEDQKHLVESTIVWMSGQPESIQIHIKDQTGQTRIVPMSEVIKVSRKK